MSKNVPYTRPYIGFSQVNVAYSICALILASLLLASKAKEVLAYGPDDGVCANIVGTANCAPGYTEDGWHPNGDWNSCHSSSAWYGSDGNGPYYNCCGYEHRYRICNNEDVGAVYFSDVEYYRYTSSVSICFPTDQYGNGGCQLTAGN